MRTVRLSIVFVSILLMVFLAGCMGANEEFIQGQWQYDSEHLANLPAESHLSVTWAFDGGHFYFYSCCFGEETELKGNYRILSEEGNILTLELYNMEGSTGRMGGELRIEVNPETDTLKIINAGPFIRMTPKYGDGG